MLAVEGALECLPENSLHAGSERPCLDKSQVHCIAHGKLDRFPTAPRYTSPLSDVGIGKNDGQSAAFELVAQSKRDLHVFLRNTSICIR